MWLIDKSVDGTVGQVQNCFFYQTSPPILVDRKINLCYNLDLATKEPTMQTATTIQFRNAVRKACANLGYQSHGGWTDAPVLHLTATRKRYVGIDVSGPKPLYFDGRVAKAVAKQTETILAQAGVTAHTRTGTRRHYAVRGTCVIV
jgi:hypothetical protein